MGTSYSFEDNNELKYKPLQYNNTDYSIKLYQLL